MNKNDYIELLHELNTLKDSINKFNPSFTISKMVKDNITDIIDKELNTVKYFININKGVKLWK